MGVVNKDRIESIEEFERLFKVNIPVPEHFDYYVDTLKRSPFYEDLGDLVERFFEYENDVVNRLGYKSAKSYKLDYALPKLVDYIKNTYAYKGLNSWEIPNVKLRKKDLISSYDETIGNAYLISIDFRSANYNALKTFDAEGELFESWSKLCRELDIHPFLVNSKSFRQYVFGNTNPNRLATFQHINIIKIIDSLIARGYKEEDFVFISHDEFIVRLDSDHRLAVDKAFSLSKAIESIVSNRRITMPIHQKIFRNKLISSGMFVQTEYELKMSGVSPKHETLFRVPGNKFFKYFKKYILNEPFDKRDLMFMTEGEVAVWAEEEDSISEVITPEGEMSLEEVKSEYSYLFDRFKSEVFGLTDSQIRKIINITTDVCTSCYMDDRSCQCWNDE